MLEVIFPHSSTLLIEAGFQSNPELANMTNFTLVFPSSHSEAEITCGSPLLIITWVLGIQASKHFSH